MNEETQNKVLAIVANITKSKNEVENSKNEQVKVAATKLQSQTDIRGIPKSGRFWKSKKERFSTINQTKGLRQSFQKKAALRIELQRTKDLSKQLLAEIKQKEIDRKERRRQNIQHAEENKRKAEVVQVITNTAKLKRMRKKQLRFIEKRDTSKVEANK